MRTTSCSYLCFPFPKPSGKQLLTSPGLGISLRLVRDIVKARWMWRCTEMKSKDQFWLAWEGWLQQSCLISSGMKEEFREGEWKSMRQAERCLQWASLSRIQPLKARCHTIKVALIWQMLFPRPLWLLLGFLPSSHIQGRRVEGRKKRERQVQQTISSVHSSH